MSIVRPNLPGWVRNEHKYPVYEHKYLMSTNAYEHKYPVFITYIFYSTKFILVPYTHRVAPVCRQHRTCSTSWDHHMNQHYCRKMYWTLRPLLLRVERNLFLLPAKSNEKSKKKKFHSLFLFLMVDIFWLTKDVVPQPTASHTSPAFGVPFERWMALKLTDILNGTSTYKKREDSETRINYGSLLLTAGQVLTLIMAISLFNVLSSYVGWTT